MSFDCLFDGSNAHLLGCKSCLHSVQYWSQGKFGMYCEKIKREADQEACEFFMYEPGTDAEEVQE